ncbi:MAG: glucose-6-phosphate isomerase [Solitalea-like symbiont of Acarus siro]
MPLISINPTTTKAWDKLKQHKIKYSNLNLHDEFSNTTDRFKRFSIQFDDLLFDYSKNLINTETFETLIELANETYLKENIENLFTLDKINITEQTSIIHTIFRSDTYNNKNFNIKNDDYNILSTLNKIEDFINKVLNNIYTSYTGKPITDVVNICIGGPLTGTQMVCKALDHLKIGKINVHFVSNIDGHSSLEVLKKIDPETSLFIIASKTFTTIETLNNAQTIKNWFLSRWPSDAIFKHHFIGITSNKTKALDFGLTDENIFPIPKEINGRFSLWSAIGLAISLYVGFDNFKLLLEGARAMDDHFRYTHFSKNMPVIAALLNIWYTNFYNAITCAIIPYDERLSLLPAYIQQLVMESNGKSVDRLGFKVNYNTSPIIWGGIGTNVQHSFFQLLHQGTHTVPCEFIASTKNETNLDNHHKILLSNLIAQISTLSFGNTSKNTFEYIPGNKPSSILLLKTLTPQTLGSMLTFYEHKVFTEGAILNICSFDQFGVETGKKLALNFFISLNSKDKDCLENIDPSVKGLIEFIKNNSNSCVREII